MNCCIKLECLSMARLSSLVYCLRERPGAYPIVEHLKGSSIVQAPVLPTKTKLERLARDKHSSLLQKSVNYGEKSFITLGPGRVDWVFYLLFGATAS